MKIYVYCIYFPTSKRLNPHYIGIAKNLERRILQHIENNFLVGNALNKYDDWIIKKLHTVKTYDEAFRIEIEEIRNFNCVAPNGYNLTAGGEGGVQCIETIEKMMKNHKGMKGLKHSKESIEKMKMSHQGVKRPNQSKFMQGNQFPKDKKNLGVSESNKKRKGEKRGGRALLNIQIAALKRSLKKLED